MLNYINKDLEGLKVNLASRLLVVFALVSLLTIVAVEGSVRSREVKVARKAFEKSLDTLSLAISLGYFQWTEMYEAFENGREDFISENLDEIVSQFSLVENVKIIDYEVSSSPSVYSVRFENGLLEIYMPIFDSEKKRFIKNRIAVVEVDPNKIFEWLGLKYLKVDNKGTDFCCGLKVRYKVLIRPASMVIGTLSGGIASLIFLLLIYKRWFSMESEVSRRHKIKSAALESLLTLLESLLQSGDFSYEDVLEAAVEIVPGAQAGSVLVKERGKFVYGAAVGYELEKLKEVEFSPDHPLTSGLRSGKVLIVKNINRYNEEYLPKEKAEILKKYGRSDLIKSTLIAPIIVAGNLEAILNLDNFESEDAFDDTSVEIARIFAVQMGIVREYITFTEKLMEKTEIFREILEFSRSLIGMGESWDYQRVLEKAIEIVPGAQAGSLLLKEGEFFVFKAVVGFDMEGLSKIKFTYDQVKRRFEGGAKIIKNISERFKNVEDEQGKLLVEHGRVLEIKATLVVPITLQDRMIGYLNLDNFEDPDAFDEESIEVATILAGQIAAVLGRTALEEKLRELAYHDPLTGVHNRRFFEEVVGKMISLASREGKPLGILYIDMKDFKRVNDTYGHDVGDVVLRTVAQRMNSVMRKNDVFARIGGDEFVVVLYGLSREKCVKVAEKLLREIEKPIEMSGKEINVSANIGIAVYPEDGRSWEELLKSADEALYIAKKKGMKIAPSKHL